MSLQSAKVHKPLTNRHLLQLRFNNARNLFSWKLACSFCPRLLLFCSLSLSFCVCEQHTHTQSPLHSTKATLLNSNLGARAGTQNSARSPEQCSLSHSQEHSSHLAMCLDLRSLHGFMHNPKQADESFATLCSPNFKSHINLPIKRSLTGCEKQWGEMAADLE